MFTVKVDRRDKTGNSRRHIYEAVSVDVFHHGGEIRGEKIICPFVQVHEPNGDAPILEVGRDCDYPCDAIYIENANGKTTDVVRAPKRL